MPPDLRRRTRAHERMDAPDASPQELRRSLGFLRFVNRWLGYGQATLAPLVRFSRAWGTGETISILDLGTGSADIPRQILRWADRRGFRVLVVGVDLHPVTARAARDGLAAGRLSIVQADVLHLPFEPHSFDYALCSLFLHHFDDDQVIAILSAMDRVARRGVIIADLLRDARAYRWIQGLALFSTPMVRHDGPASVAQGFRREEILALRDRAGLQYARYHQPGAWRFVLAGQKPAARAG